MDAVDHMEFHPSSASEGESSSEESPPEEGSQRKKCSTVFLETGRYESTDCTLSPEDEEFMDLFLLILERVNKDLHAQITRDKWSVALVFPLGWGVYSNSKQIKKIKENLRVLEGQNILQEFKNCLLAKYLNLTYTMVNRCEQMLFEVDSRLYIIEETLKDIMNTLSHI